VMATPTSSTSSAKCSTSLITVLPVQSKCLPRLIIRLIIQRSDGTVLDPTRSTSRAT
jgi:hypothetical protein